MWPDIQNLMLRMTSTCNQILEDRVWQELVTPALRGFLINGVAFRGRVRDTFPSFISSFPTCRFSLCISLSLSCELDTLPAVAGSLLLEGCGKTMWVRQNVDDPHTWYKRRIFPYRAPSWIWLLGPAFVLKT